MTILTPFWSTTCEPVRRYFGGIFLQVSAKPDCDPNLRNLRTISRRAGRWAVHSRPNRSTLRSGAWISGPEASYLQHFSFPGHWRGLGLCPANLRLHCVQDDRHPGPLRPPKDVLRTSPNALNVSPTWDRGRFSIRVALSYNQASIYSYQYTDGTAGGVNGPLSDLYFYSHFQVDAQGSVLHWRMG